MPAAGFYGETGSGKSNALATAVEPGQGKIAVVDMDAQFFGYIDNSNIRGLSEVARVAVDVPEFGLRAGDKAVAIKGLMNIDNLRRGLPRFIEAAVKDGATAIGLDPATLAWRQAMEGYTQTQYVDRGEEQPDEYKFGEWRKIKKPYREILSLIRRYPALLFVLTFRPKDQTEKKTSATTGKTSVVPIEGPGVPDAGDKQTMFEIPCVFRTFIEGNKYKVSCTKQKWGLYKVGQEWMNPTGAEVLQPFTEMMKRGVMPVPEDEEAEASKAGGAFESPLVAARKELEQFVIGWVERARTEGPDGPWLAEARAAWGRLTPQMKEKLKAAKEGK